MYHENKEILAFLTMRYENVCEDLQFPKKFLMTILCSQVTGMLADLMGHLTIEQSRDYDGFKDLDRKGLL